MKKKIIINKTCKFDARTDVSTFMMYMYEMKQKIYKKI